MSKLFMTKRVKEEERRRTSREWENDSWGLTSTEAFRQIAQRRQSCPSHHPPLQLQAKEAAALSEAPPAAQASGSNEAIPEQNEDSASLNAHTALQASKSDASSERRSPGVIESK